MNSPKISDKRIISSRGLKSVYKAFYWLLPPILMYIIFNRIDLDLFLKKLSGVNKGLLLLGLCYYPTVVLISGFRWHLTLVEYFRLRLPIWYLVRHYWVGMALGFFSPGQLGLDAYRVVVIGKRCGNFMKMIFSILVEKAMALLNAVVMVICLYPIVKRLAVKQSPVLDQIVNVSYWGAVLSLGVCGLVYFFARHRIALRLANSISALMLRLIKRMKGVLETECVEKDAADTSGILALLADPKPFLLVFASSLAIQFVSALGNQIIFLAVGYKIPLVVNLFITPIFYFVFLLPVSFGSLGVREGAYVLFYGFFGVPPEIALLVSFVNLAGILFNNAIGAALIWFSKNEGNGCQNMSVPSG